MNSCFDSRVAVVTGAASGIGAALAAALARAGAVVWAVDRNRDALEERGAALAAAGHPLHCAGADVTDFAAVNDLIQTVAARHGRLDYLFNNAGVGLAGEALYTELADWQRVLAVNLWGVIHGVHAVWPLLVRQGSGHVVNVASGAGLCPRPGMAAYAAAKHAVVGLSTSLRGEGAAYGVKVSVACPGHVDTGIFAASVYRRVDRVRLLRSVPTRPLSPERCAQAILRGVRRNQAVILIGGLHRLEWWLQRASPALVERLNRLRAARFRQARVAEAPAARRPH